MYWKSPKLEWAGEVSDVGCASAMMLAHATTIIHSYVLTRESIFIYVSLPGPTKSLTQSLLSLNRDREFVIHNLFCSIFGICHSDLHYDGTKFWSLSRQLKSIMPPLKIPGNTNSNPPPPN